MSREKTAEDVLHELVADIENTGGLVKQRAHPYTLVPAADPTWSDLACTYLDACKVLGVEPMIEED